MFDVLSHIRNSDHSDHSDSDSDIEKAYGTRNHGRHSCCKALALQCQCHSNVSDLNALGAYFGLQVVVVGRAMLLD